MRTWVTYRRLVARFEFFGFRWVWIASEIGKGTLQPNNPLFDPLNFEASVPTAFCCGAKRILLWCKVVPSEFFCGAKHMNAVQRSSY